MQVSDNQIWLGSILLSIFIYGLLFVQWSVEPGDINSLNQLNITKTTKLRFNISEEAPAENDAEITQSVRKNPIRQPAEIEALPREIATSKITTNTSQAENESTIDKPNEESETTTKSSVDTALIIEQREQYMVELLEHIEKHKFYPASARRRELSGKVNVRFSLNSDGQIADLVIHSQYTILKAAANEAIQSSLPMPVPADNFSFPIQINFNMIYAIH